MYFTHFLEEASRRWEQAGMPWQYTPLCFPAEHKGYLSLQAPSDSLLLDVNFMTFPEKKRKKSSFPSGPDCNLNPPPGEIDFTQVLPCSLNDTVSLKISPLLAMDCCWALFPVRTHSTRRWDGGKERDEGKEREWRHRTASNMELSKSTEQGLRYTSNMPQAPSYHACINTHSPSCTSQ